MSETQVRVFVDAVEDDVAFLVAGDRRVAVPRFILPTLAKEGSWLQIVVADDDGLAKEIAERRARLSASDPGGDIKL